MGMAAILIHELWPFVQIVNSRLTESSTWNFKQIVSGFQEEKSV